MYRSEDNPGDQYRKFMKMIQTWGVDCHGGAIAGINPTYYVIFDSGPLKDEMLIVGHGDVPSREQVFSDNLNMPIRISGSRADYVLRCLAANLGAT